MVVFQKIVVVLHSLNYIYFYGKKENPNFKKIGREKAGKSCIQEFIQNYIKESGSGQKTCRTKNFCPDPCITAAPVCPPFLYDAT